MQHQTVVRLSVPLACLGIAIAAAGAARGAPPHSSAPRPFHRPTEMYFELNAGQAPKPVRFLTRGRASALYLTPGEAILSLSAPTHPGRVSSAEAPRFGPRRHHALRMRVVGGNAHAVLEGVCPQRARANYLIGADPRGWHTDIPAFRQVRYQAVYPGVDLRYHGREGVLEYDFVVAPGADPGAIRLAYTGADRISLARNGELTLTTPLGAVRQGAPVAYQEIGGKRRSVAAAFYLTGDNRQVGSRKVGFRLGAYDSTRPLFIDPTLWYSTYLGGIQNDIALAVATHPSGRIAVTGQTGGGTFPTTEAVSPNRGGLDAFTVTIDSNAITDDSFEDGTLIGGAAADIGTGIAIGADTTVPGSGPIFVCGNTQATNFPATAGALRTTFQGGIPPNIWGRGAAVLLPLTPGRPTPDCRRRRLR